MLTTMSIQIAAFSAGIVLLINVWGGRKRGLALDQDREMHDVWSCMNFLSVCEKTCVQPLSQSPALPLKAWLPPSDEPEIVLQ